MSIDRVTLPLLLVVAVLRDRPNEEHHGYAVAKEPRSQARECTRSSSDSKPKTG
jgi:hypothetical protein